MVARYYLLVLDTVYLSFLKIMLGVKQQTTSVPIYEYTGRYPLFIKQKKSCAEILDSIDFHASNLLFENRVELAGVCRFYR